MKNKQFSHYDIIGDIHGHADALIRLLNKMGYQTNPDGIYAHPDRLAVFLGDYIDRGPQQSQVVNIVKSMVEYGSALAIMGNHEFNAICYHSSHPETGKPLRKHNKQTLKQHQAFLKEYPLAKKDTRAIINWFKTLPVFIEFDEFRVIHACWNETALESIEPLLKTGNRLTQELLLKAGTPDTNEFYAIETLLKGLEIALPEGNLFYDKDGSPRTHIRVKWWQNDAATYRDYALLPDSSLNDISNMPLAKTILKPEYNNAKPVLFGHYWFTGKPQIQKDNVACLDYSLGNEEKLVCYQWNKGDKKLSNDQFVIVDHYE
ncbi:MAG: hypothetical protein DRQ43_00750 [Gammaproteobacteria bacterium]|nr:MAG: hypothetical protein DRQ43_00750 [Gammaproteobacteria bacterium]